jgi:hypothetical protein
VRHEGWIGEERVEWGGEGGMDKQQTAYRPIDIRKEITRKGETEIESDTVDGEERTL